MASTSRTIGPPADSAIGVSDRIVELPVTVIKTSPYQVRACRDQEHIAALALSIDDNELSSPILVRPTGDDGAYELVCGEYRWEAHKLLGRETITSIIRSLSDAEAAKILAADNLQRRELSDWQVCQTINMLLSNGFATTDNAIARILGRPRPYITKTRAFNDLSEGAAALVSGSPHLFGTSLAFDLRSSGYNKKHPALVEEAFAKVVSGALTQAGVITWLRSRTTPTSATALKDSTIKINNRKVRITVYQDTIRISCKGMNSLDIEAGLQTALKALL